LKQLDNRYLSHLELLVNGAHPLLLGSNLPSALFREFNWFSRSSDRRGPGTPFCEHDRNRHLEALFRGTCCYDKFICQKPDRSTEFFLFLLATLTLCPAMSKSTVRSPFGRIAGFDGAACAAEKR